MKIASILLILMGFQNVVHSAVIHVPGDYPTIQQAMDAALDGDTVLVSPGTYTENLDFAGKAITVTSEEGPEVTVIDGQYQRVVVFANGEGSDSVMEGFTICKGGNGGGIYCEGASPRISNNWILDSIYYGLGGGISCIAGSNPVIEKCRISRNMAYIGGGIYCIDSSPLIVENTIEGNCTIPWPFIDSNGGGIYLKNSSPQIKGNLIAKNITDSDSFMWGNGAGLYMEDDSSPSIEGNRFIQNSSDYSGGGLFIDDYCLPEVEGNLFLLNAAKETGTAMYCSAYTGITIAGNLIAFNTSPGTAAAIICSGGAAQILTNNTIYGNSGYGIYCGANSSPVITNTILWANTSGQIQNYDGNPVVTHCNVQGGWIGTGNIDEEPQFVDPSGPDFHLQYISPCRNAGDNGATGLPDEDFEEDPRVAEGTVDMGADEFHRHFYCTGDATPGGAVEGKFIGLPGASPVGFWLGSAVLDPPWPSAFGPWYLEPPLVLIGPLGAIPSSGVLILGTTLPVTAPVPVDVPMQALIGNELTNYFVLEIR
jgi:hypothetical protein